MNTKTRLDKLEARFLPASVVTYANVRVDPGFSGPIYLHENVGGARARWQVWETFPTLTGLTKEGNPSREMFYESQKRKIMPQLTR